MDLTLPPTAPVTRYHEEPMSLLPAALYTLVDLSDNDLRELQRVCESGCPDSQPGDNVRLSPQPRFVGRSLHAVYESHVELGEQREYDPIYFIVAIHEDWRQNGVLLVALDDGDLQCKTDSFVIKASDCGPTIVNLQIGNSEWEAEKESYGIKSDDSGDNDDRGDDGDDGKDENEGAGAEDDDSESLDSGPDYPRSRPASGFYIPIYVIDSVDADQLVRDSLEPGAKLGKYDPFEDYYVRVQARLKPSVTSSNPRALDPSVTTDLVSQACIMHPWRCHKNEWLHRTIILVCDNALPSEYGLALVQLSWNGQVRYQARAELREIGAAAERDVRRMPATVYGIQEVYCNLVNGVRLWRAAHPLVAVFQFGVASGETEFGMELLDHGARRRKTGDERVVYGPRRVPTERKPFFKVIEWSFAEAVRRFPWLCREHRFDENFLRGYFICVDNEELEKAGVLVVRVDWDEDVSRGDEELLGLRSEDQVSTLRVPVKEALDMIEAAVKKDASGMNSEAIQFFGLE